MSALRAIDKDRFPFGRFITAAVAILFSLLSPVPEPSFAIKEIGQVYDGSGPTISVAQIRLDDDGKPLDYPTAVYYDPTEEEIYLVNGISGRVIVYGPDFFPRMSIGLGRGIGAPRGGVVTPDGRVYICQARTARSPAHRLTVLNGAFFIDRDIVMEDIPEAADFSPRSVAVSKDGIIYVAGDNSRGLLVLDQDGSFLRWIKPTGKIRDRAAIAAAAEEAGEEGTLPDEETEAAENEGGGAAEIPEAYADIPEEFRPRNLQGEAADGKVEGTGPVKVNNVTIDSAGNLYLLSAEVGKVYVYGPDESFLFSFGEKGGSPRQMSQPRDLAIDEEHGLIYIVDYMRHTILAYNMSGKYIFEFGGRGTGPGWFNFPAGIAVNRHGQVIIADQFNKRLQVLRIDFDFVFPLFGGEGTEGSGDSGDAGESSLSDQGDVEAAGSDSPVGEIPAAEQVEETIVPVVEIPGYTDEGVEGEPPAGEAPEAPLGGEEDQDRPEDAVPNPPDRG